MLPSRLVKVGKALGLSLLVSAVAVGSACGSSPVTDVTVRYDSGGVPDATAPVDASEGGLVEDPTLGGPCTDDAQCSDGIACTFDRCDKTLSRCRNTPDDTQCADSTYCNGKERCVPRLGCRAGEPVTCQDGDSCTVDSCIEESKSCERVFRDVDGDGEADDHCVGGKDCDDLDPGIGSQRAEICGNGKDDNCNRRVDETPCSSPQDDTCATARTVTAPVLVQLTTVATKRDFSPTCSVGSPAASRDVVVKIVVPGNVGDPPKDLEVFATSLSGDTAVSLLSACVASGSELGCGHTKLTPQARARARSVVPGTYYAVVTTQDETAVELSVDLLPATTAPTNEACASPTPVPTDTPFQVTLVDAKKDLASACTSETGELTYSFTLTEPRDVRILTSRLKGSGSPVVSFRDPSCTGELRCRSSSSPALLSRSLPAGTHVISVAGTAASDVNVILQTSAPTAPPPNGTCAAPPAIAFDSTVTVDLSGYDEIPTNCLPGGPTAAYALQLSQASDVLLVGRFPTNESGAVSLEDATCSSVGQLACQKDTTPARVGRRNVPPGNYRALVHDERGQVVSLGVFVRPTVAPVTVTTDTCAGAPVIPPQGGFFTGDTAGKGADFSASCDNTGGMPNGAPDQILRLDLPAPKRVIFDMQGSTFSTLLAIRQGATCPGTEVVDGCYVGARGSRSFLDMSLAAGTYWVQIDGYAGAAGPWNLDVRVLPP
jgi:hypothetical protein